MDPKIRLTESLNPLGRVEGKTSQQPHSGFDSGTSSVAAMKVHLRGRHFYKRLALDELNRFVRYLRFHLHQRFREFAFDKRLALGV